MDMPVDTPIVMVVTASYSYFCEGLGSLPQLRRRLMIAWAG
jgi:hypothetical protein